MTSGARSLAEAHLIYQGYRDATYAIIWNTWKLVVGPGLGVHPINDKALKFWRQHWLPLMPLVRRRGFPWDLIADQFQGRPSRFEVALWYNEVLCALVMGTASKATENVTIRFIERLPVDGNPLRGYVVPIARDLGLAYAKIIGRQMLRVKNPAEGAIAVYERANFRLANGVKGGTYYEQLVVEPEQ